MLILLTDLELNVVKCDKFMMHVYEPCKLKVYIRDMSI